MKTILFGVLIVFAQALHATPGSRKVAPAVVVFEEDEVPFFLVVEKEGKKRVVIVQPLLQASVSR